MLTDNVYMNADRLLLAHIKARPHLRTLPAMMDRKSYVIGWLRRRMFLFHSRAYRQYAYVIYDPRAYSDRRVWWDSDKAWRLLVFMFLYILFGTVVLVFVSLCRSSLIRLEEAFIEPPVRASSHSSNPDLVDLSRVPVKPPHPSLPTLVHILAYQRTGSTFTSGLLGQDPRVFYVFEPLEMMYTAMYGLVESWTKVGDDIFNDSEGQPRSLSSDELSATEWVMEQIYNCSMSSLPTSILINHYWHKYSRNMPHVPEYWNCIVQSGANLTHCQQPIRHLCAPRFSTMYGKLLYECKILLWNKNKWYTDTTDIVWRYLDDGVFKRSSFSEYFQCLDKFTTAARDCAYIFLDVPCKVRKIRAIKTVRSDSHISARFLSKYPNFRLIHILRDPRGVALSRSKKQWAQGLFEKGDMTRIASTYCQNVLGDYIGTVVLRNRYEGQVMHVVTDEVMKDLPSNARALFSFLNLTMLLHTHDFIHNQTQPAQAQAEMTPYVRINLWRTELSRLQLGRITAVCQSLFRDLKYNWYYSKLKLN